MSDLHGLAQLARDATDLPGEPRQAPPALLDRIDGTRSRRRKQLVLAACTLLVLGGAGAWWARDPISKSRPVVAGVVTRFADGSELELFATGRAELATDATGTTIVLLSGRAQLRAMPLGGSTHVRLAGGDVEVINGPARFFASMTTDGAGIEVDQGVVQVRTTLGVRRIVRGERLNLSEPLEQAHPEAAPTPAAPLEAPAPKSERPPSPPKQSAPKPRPVPAAAQPAPLALEATSPLAPEPEAGPSTASPVLDWSRLLAAEGAAAVLSAARPYDVAFEQRSSTDLVALGDAARYSRQLELAEKAYGAVRQRFAGTRDAAHALFLLGRVAEQRFDRVAAVKAYADYELEAPTGGLAAEALGRRILMMEPSDQQRCALVNRYLQRYPQGTMSERFSDLCQ